MSLLRPPKHAFDTHRLPGSLSLADRGGSDPGLGTPVQHNDTFVATESILDFEDSASVTWTLTDDPTNHRLKVSAAAAGGSSIIFWPAADQADASYDTTTYANSYTGSGHYDALMFSSSGGPAVAIGLVGDAYPRFIVTPTLGDSTGFANRGIFLSDGTVDPISSGAGIACYINPTPGDNDFILFNYNAAVAASGVGRDGSSDFGLFGRLHLLTTQGGGLGVNHMAGKGVPARGGDIGDIYWRSDGGVGSTVYRCTTAGNAGVAVWGAIL